MNINCEIDLQEKGAPLAFDKTWNFEYQDDGPTLSGGVTDFAVSSRKVCHSSA